MITFTNGRSFEYFIASGALAFDGRGWLWERPLVRLGLIRPEVFAVALKSLNWDEIKGNLRWWKPWECVRPTPGNGTVNKVGMTNPGFPYWKAKIAPKMDFSHRNIIVSLYGGA